MIGCPISELAPVSLLACPWCGSEKVMAEGTDKRMAMVCQKCLARGPEVNVNEGRDWAIHRWNKAIRPPTTPKATFKCENCGLPAIHIWYGTAGRWRWRHQGIKGKRLACKQLKVGQANAADQRPGTRDASANQ